MAGEVIELVIEVAGSPVSALLERPRDARALLVLAHGAGAGMRHPFLAALAGAFAARGIATLRYQFPYMESGSRRPDRAPLLEAAVRAAVTEAARREPALPLFAGGKSMGGRMSSQAHAASPLPIRGLVFVGFPLHPARKPGTARAEHLSRVALPMLFLQGTRDDLADLALLRPICASLPGAELVVVDGADHSFRVPVRSGGRAADVLDHLAATAAGWMLRSSGTPAAA